MAGVAFIAAGTNVDRASPDIHMHADASKTELQQRWANPEGLSIQTAWRDSGYDRDRLNSLVGTFYGKTDLRGIQLVGENLSRKDLSDIEFYGADFRRASLEAAILRRSYLSEADLRGTNLRWAAMDDVLIDNANFDRQTDLGGVALNGVNFALAELLSEQAHTQQRIDHLTRRNPLLAKFLWITCDYGRSLGRWLLWVCGVIAFFGILYWLRSTDFKDLGTVLDGLYFSTITFTTLGYGDIYRLTEIGKILVMAEVSIGYMMGGLLVAILAKRLLG